MNRSGQRGLSDFFAHEEAYLEGVTADPGLAILPLTPNWQTTDFSLPAVTRGEHDPVRISIRSWSLKLLSRYLYTIGEWAQLCISALFTDLPIRHLTCHYIIISLYSFPRRNTHHVCFDQDAMACHKSNPANRARPFHSNGMFQR